MYLRNVYTFLFISSYWIKRSKENLLASIFSAFRIIKNSYLYFLFKKCCIKWVYYWECIVWLLSLHNCFRLNLVLEVYIKIWRLSCIFRVGQCCSSKPANVGDIQPNKQFSNKGEYDGRVGGGWRGFCCYSRQLLRVNMLILCPLLE
jgi:hypothetical protein